MYGHPAYLVSPALQHRPEDIDKRAADMYSFAVILWEIATNKVPFSGLSPMHVGIKVMWTPLIRPLLQCMPCSGLQSMGHKLEGGGPGQCGRKYVHVYVCSKGVAFKFQAVYTIRL